MDSKSVLDQYVEPSRIFGNLYFVGIRAVCTHLIDTGDGLILIDPGVSESLHVIADNIRKSGFNPADIRYIIASHAHYDHMDSVAELSAVTGAKTFIGKADLPLLTGELYHYPIKPFTPDVLLEDGDVITLGNTAIRCVSTPGHTDGTMSFFFDVTDGEKTYRAGLFGGAGTNTLRRSFLEEHGLPFDNRQKFIDSIKKLSGEKVEIFLGNHLENNRTEEKLKKLKEQQENPFIVNSKEEWDAFLDERMSAINRVISQNL